MNVFLFSVLQEKPNQKCCMRANDGRQRVEEPFALIPDVSDEAVSAEVQATSL